jgi:hypothetical protein
MEELKLNRTLQGKKFRVAGLVKTSQDLKRFPVPLLPNPNRKVFR